MFKYDCSDMTIQNSVCKAISQSCKSLEKDLYNNIVVAGGNTKLKGFAERLEKEVFNHTSFSGTIEVSSTAHKHSEWFAGSVMSTMSTFESKCLSKSEYEEYGFYSCHKFLC